MTMGWPLAVLIFLIIFIFTFKQQIVALLSKIQSVGKDGIKLGSSPDQQKDEQKKESVRELMNIGENEVVLIQEDVIKENLCTKNLNLDGDAVKVLIRELAITQLALDFEQIHSNIFGSQIFLLKKLNEMLGYGRPQIYIENHFAQVQKKFPEYGEWRVNNYLAFLFNNFLITIENDNYHISKKGHEFLSWIVKTGHTEDKNL